MPWVINLKLIYSIKSDTPHMFNTETGKNNFKSLHSSHVWTKNNKSAPSEYPKYFNESGD